MPFDAINFSDVESLMRTGTKGYSSSGGVIVMNVMLESSGEVLARQRFMQTAKYHSEERMISELERSYPQNRDWRGRKLDCIASCTPCTKCVDGLLEYLRKRPNVELTYRVASLDLSHGVQSKVDIRRMVGAGIKLQTTVAADWMRLGLTSCDIQLSWELFTTPHCGWCQIMAKLMQKIYLKMSNGLITLIPDYHDTILFTLKATGNRKESTTNHIYVSGEKSAEEMFIGDLNRDGLGHQFNGNINLVMTNTKRWDKLVELISENKKVESLTVRCIHSDYMGMDLFPRLVVKPIKPYEFLQCIMYLVAVYFGTSMQVFSVDRIRARHHADDVIFENMDDICHQL